MNVFHSHLLSLRERWFEIFQCFPWALEWRPPVKWDMVNDTEYGILKEYLGWWGIKCFMKEHCCKDFHSWIFLTQIIKSIKKDSNGNIFYSRGEEEKLHCLNALWMISHLLCFDREDVNITSNTHSFNIISKVLPFAFLWGFPSEQSEWCQWSHLW